MSQEELNKQATEQNNTETEIEDIKEDKKVVKNDEYTIKIIPNKTDDVKLFTISKNMLRYVMASVVIMIVLVVGSLSFAGYVYFNNQADKQHLQELQEANALQQQQLSELDKKANSLKEDMDQAIDNMQRRVCGKVVMKVFKGNIHPLTRESDFSLHDIEQITFEDKETDQREVEGMIKYHGIQAANYQKLNQ